MANLRFGVDLITFFDPAFWNFANEAAVVAYGKAEPRAFWDRMLATLAETEATGIELTFAPFDWQGMLAAYGSVESAQFVLEQHGLEIASGFFADVAIENDLLSLHKQDDYIRRAGPFAAFLAAMGAEAMVMGLPMRQSWNADPAFFVDLTYVSKVADFCNRLGSEVLRHGVKLALHTEAHSTFSLARDVDLLLMLTDPVYVGFCPDTAHLTLVGADPIAVVERHKSRMVLAHWKDALGRMPDRLPIDETVHLQHRPYFCALGAGRVDWPSWMRLLRDDGYRGWAIVEIDAVPDPRDEIRRSLAYVQTSLGPIYS